MSVQALVPFKRLGFPSAPKSICQLDELSKSDIIRVRILAQYILLAGDEGEEYSTTSRSYGTVFSYENLGQRYHTHFFSFPVEGSLKLVIGTKQWEAHLRLSVPTSRSMVDLRGHKLIESYDPGEFPFINYCGNLIESSPKRRVDQPDWTAPYHLRVFLWKVLFGKLSRKRGEHVCFTGDPRAFDRDLIMLEMDDDFIAVTRQP